MSHTRMYKLFKRLVESNPGLQAARCGDGQFQIRGGTLTVNYYPTTSTYYVNGTHKGKSGSLQDAIKAATRIPDIIPKEERARHPNQNRVKRIRRSLLRRRGNKCHWCKGEMSPNTFIEGGVMNPDQITLDHKIPRCRGGSNGVDNLVLAHNRCNSDRGSDMKEYQRNNEEPPCPLS